MPRKLAFTAKDLDALLSEEHKAHIKELVALRNTLRQTAWKPGYKREFEKLIDVFIYSHQELERVSLGYGKGKKYQTLNLKDPEVIWFIQRAIKEALVRNYGKAFTPPRCPDGTIIIPQRFVAVGEKPEAPTIEFRIIEGVIYGIDFRKVNPPPSLYSLMAATAELFGLTDENDTTTKDAKNAISGRLSRVERGLIALIYKKRANPPKTSTP